jgi:hypothetical protein
MANKQNLATFGSFLYVFLAMTVYILPIMKRLGIVVLMLLIIDWRICLYYSYRNSSRVMLNYLLGDSCSSFLSLIVFVFVTLCFR